MAPRLPPLDSPTIGFGLRGAADHAPANTIEGFHLALKLGATGLTSDAWPTADGDVALSTSGRFGGRFRGRSVVDVAASDLPPEIPALSRFYAEIGTDHPLALDVVHQAAFEPAVAVARSAGGDAENRLWLCHDDLDLLTEWRSRTTARLINVVGRRRLDGGLERRAAELQERGIDGLRLFHQEWSGGKVALLHRFNRLALADGARHERELAQVVDGGIDGVYCGHVDRMAAVLDQFFGGAEQGA